MAKFHDLKPEKQKAILLMTKQMLEPNGKKMVYHQIAKECGIDVNTLFRWRTDDKDFREARKKLVDTYAQELVIDAFVALRKQLHKNNNVKAAEVVLKSQGMLIDRKEGAPDTVIHLEVGDRDNASLQAELDMLRNKLMGSDEDITEP
jgi:hypothetical protein